MSLGVEHAGRGEGGIGLVGVGGPEIACAGTGAGTVFAGRAVASREGCATQRGRLTDQLMVLRWVCPVVLCTRVVGARCNAIGLPRRTERTVWGESVLCLTYASSYRQPESDPPTPGFSATNQETGTKHTSNLPIWYTLPPLNITQYRVPGLPIDQLQNTCIHVANPRRLTSRSVITPQTSPRA